MPGKKIFSAPADRYSAIQWGDYPAYKRYAYIVDVLVQHLGSSFSGILAAPHIQPNIHDWYSDVLTENAIPLRDADATTQEIFRTKIDMASQELAELIARFEKMPDENMRQLAKKLTHVLRFPDEGHIFIDPTNGNYSITAWGFEYAPIEGKKQAGIKILADKTPLPPVIYNQEEGAEAPLSQKAESGGESGKQPQNSASATEKSELDENSAPSAETTVTPPEQKITAASPPDNKQRRWIWILAALVLILLLALVYMLLKNTTSDPYRNVLPDKPDVLPPIDTTQIIVDEDDPLGQTILANRLNAYLTPETDLKSFALDFKAKFPDPAVKIVYYTSAANRLMVEFPVGLRDSIRNTLEASKHVEFIMDETIFSGQTAVSPFNDPGFQDNRKTWHMEAIQLFDAWEVTRGSANVTVAIIDDGFDMKHPEFQGQIVHPWNVPANSKYPDQGVTRMFHGTHVAGIAAAKADNHAGIAGIAPMCKIMPVQVGNPFGLMTTSAIVDGIFYAYHHGAQVINLSLGSSFTADLSGLSFEEQERLATTLYPEQERFWTQLFKLLHDKGIVVVQAAGNSNILASIDPMQRNPYTIKVTATDPTNRKATFSNFGDVCHLSAPGTAIYSSVPGNQYSALDGTSMAAPIVSGAVALLKSNNPAITPTECRNALLETGLDVGVNIGRLIQLADALGHTPSESPCDEELDQLREEV